MVNKYTLGGAVLSIFLLAIFGVNRALNWLTQSTSETAAEDRIVAVNANDTNGALSPDAQSNRSADGQIISQADDSNVDLLPLEEAGTYIQRQQSIDPDAAVAGSAVEMSPSNNDSFPVAQSSDTINNPQPTQPEVVDDPGSTTPTPTPAPAVPALW
ncbi:MAG: hypothetical protein ACR2FS_08245 [Phormidesmis sp.]